MARLREAQWRHAQHYADVLRQIREGYEQGGDARKLGLQGFVADKWQIEAAQQWSASHRESNLFAAELCGAFCSDQEFLSTVLTPVERCSWFGAAVAAAKQLGQSGAVK